MPNIIPVDRFKAEVVDSEVPVILTAYAGWCGPCVKFADTLDALQAMAGERVKIVMIDIDELDKHPDPVVERALNAGGKLEGVPSSFRFHNKRVSSNVLVGNKPLHETLAWAERVLGFSLAPAEQPLLVDPSPL